MRKVLTAMLLSFVGPGLGQIYNREYKRGVFLLIASSALFLLPLIWVIANVSPHLPNPSQELVTQEELQKATLEAIGQHKHLLNLVTLLFLGVWAYSITQAYFKAKEIQDKEAPRKDLNSPGADDA